MRPVDQTTFGYPNGNCFPACLASLLHLSIEDVPHFGDDDWFDRFAAWLRPRGLYPVCVPKQDDWRPAGFHILSGRSPRGDFMHAVVAFGAEIVHDPHPSRAGILTREDTIHLVPLDPSTVARTNT